MFDVRLFNLLRAGTLVSNINNFNYTVNQDQHDQASSPWPFNTTALGSMISGRI